MVAYFHSWGTSPVLHTLTSILKVPEKLRVVEFQYFSWEGVWPYRFPVRHTPDYPPIMSSIVGSIPSDGAKGRQRLWE